MCLKCHEGSTNEQALHWLKESLETPEFEKWYYCPVAISHMFISYSGVDGLKVQDLAGKVIENLVEWQRQNDKTTDGKAFCHADNIEKRYLNMKNDPNLKIEPSEIPKRKEAVFHGNFLSKYEPESMYGKCGASKQN